MSARAQAIELAVRLYWDMGGVFRETLIGIGLGKPVNLFVAHCLMSWIATDAARRIENLKS